MNFVDDPRDALTDEQLRAWGAEARSAGITVPVAHLFDEPVHRRRWTRHGKEWATGLVAALIIAVVIATLAVHRRPGGDTRPPTVGASPTITAPHYLGALSRTETVTNLGWILSPPPPGALTTSATTPEQAYQFCFRFELCRYQSSAHPDVYLASVTRPSYRAQILWVIDSHNALCIRHGGPAPASVGSPRPTPLPPSYTCRSLTLVDPVTGSFAGFASAGE